MLITFRTSFLLVLAATALCAQPKGKLDLFLLIGQSNMAGRGVPEAADKEPVAGVWKLDAEMKWVPAVDPLHFDRPKVIGVGIGRSFAKALKTMAPQAEIGLIPAAVGGTSLDQWAPEGELFADAVKRTKAALASGTLRGILWHQGESDSSKQEKALDYAERWVTFVKALRLAVGDVPVVVGQLGTFYGRNVDVDQSSYASVVNEQLSMLPVQVERVAFVPSYGLNHKGDKVHFDAPSLREFGRRYAMAFLMLEPAWGGN